VNTVIEEIARRWEGRFHNHRQVLASEARGGPAAPELTRERRRLEVHRLEAPQLGRVVLYFQEFRATRPELAHRQRVVSLVVDPEAGCVRAEQLFLRGGPTYDRPPLEASAVAELSPEAFERHPGCDLFFRHEPEPDRWRGGMRPGACVYPHPDDGPVCADFEMLLHPDQLWYRDRSVRVADGTVRGEVDGFSWLLFDRAEAPILRPRLLEQQGVWRGTFRRTDADGSLQETFPSEIVIRVLGDAGNGAGEGVPRYHQTNLYRPENGPERRIEAHGTIADGRVWFRGSSYEGWAMDLDSGGHGRSCLIVMHSLDGSGPDVHEIVSLSEDGLHRARCAQFLRGGRLVGRTLIEEEKVSDDWRTWDAGRTLSPPPPAAGG
jgi:hypothetical protein